MSFPFDNLTLDLLIVALSIFAWLAARSRNIRSFQFQISLFIVIWIIGEIIDLLEEENLSIFPSTEIGMQVHVLAMGLFSAMLWIRFYLSNKSGKKLADTMREN